MTPNPSPPTTFRTFILRSAQLTLDALQTAAAILTPAERDQALHTLSFSIKLEEAWPLTREILLTLAPKMELMGHRYDWMPYLERGVEESTQRGDLNAAAEYALQLGILYRMVSEFATAKQVVNISIDHFIAASDKRGQARALNELAWIEHLTHEYTLAIEHVNASLTLLDEGDAEQGISYRILGLVAIEQKSWSRAISNSRRALNIFVQSIPSPT